jgi:DNA repair protein RadD
MSDLFAERQQKTLRPYQANALTLVRSSIAAGNRRVVLCLPTGGGKTLIAANIVRGALAKGGRAVFTAPMISLIDQTVSGFEAEGISQIGVIQAKHPRTDEKQPVQICSVQTLARKSSLPEATVVLIDEVHVYSKVVSDWMADRPDLIFIGLSATPARKGMRGEWDDLVVGVTTRELIDLGYLSEFTVYAPSTPNMSGVRIVAGEYHTGQAQAVMEDATLVGDILQNYLINGEDRPTLGFATSVAHAKNMAEEFCNAGVPSAAIDARTDSLERRAIVDQFTAGKIKVIWSVRTMTTGVDLPVSGIIDAAPTRSVMLHTQKIGRGLRVNEGTEDLKIWDHAGNTLRLGFIDELDWSELKDGTREEKEKREEPLPKNCQQCNMVMPPKTKVCPSCGHAMQPPSGWVETADGELVPINREVGAKDVPMAEKERFYRELIGVCRETGKKDGMAYFKYKEKFGVFPANTFSKIPLEPSLQTRSWLKSKQIAYAKRKEREHAN